MAILINIFLVWLDVHLRLYANVGISACMVPVLMVLMPFTTRVIRIHRARLHSLEAEQHRPDWAEIDRMDREIFGRAFDHGRGGGAGLWT